MGLCTARDHGDRRDPIRLAFALLGPMLLMIVFGYGISFDVENLSYAALDYDNTPESRVYLENFAELAVLQSARAAEERSRSGGAPARGAIKLAIEIPSGFGRDLRRGRPTDVAVWLDGAQPFRAETSRGYVEGVHQAFLREIARYEGEPPAQPPANVEFRFRYNQEFRSVFAIVPGVMMMLLVLIPAVMTALGVVREKELGSITNLYVTPTRGLEFCWASSCPTSAIALINFVTLLALALFLFEVPVKGSVAALTLAPRCTSSPPPASGCSSPAS